MNNKFEKNLIDLKVTNDLVFQRIFGKVGNEDITKGFLEAILGIKIKNISLDRNKRMQLNKLDNKIGRLDIKAELNDGMVVHIEIQTTEYEYMEERILFYNSEAYVERLARSQDYKKLNKVVTILIYEHNLKSTQGIPKYHTIWNYREKDYPEKVLTYDSEFHIIELKKFDINKEHGLEADWIKFIKVKEMKDMDKIEEINESIKKAKKELEYLASDPAMQEEYKERAKELRDKISFYSYYREKGLRDGLEQGLQEGRKKGLQEGRKKGLQEGRKKGLQEGRKEGLQEGKQEEKIRIAQNMKLKKIPIKDIIELTGLTQEQIENI